MAQNKMKWAPTSNAFQTTLNGAINATATTITLNSVTGLQNKAGTLVIDRVNSAGTATPSSREYIYFTGVSGSSVTLPSVGDGRGQGGSTGQSHADGAIVEAIIDVDQWNGLVDSYDVQHNDAGTHAALTTDTFSATSLVSISSSLFVAGQGNFPSTVSINQTDVTLAKLTNLNFGSLASGVVLSSNYKPTAVRLVLPGNYSLITAANASVPSSVVTVSVIGPSMAKVSLTADVTTGGANDNTNVFMFLDGTSLGANDNAGISTTDLIRATIGTNYLVSLASGTHNFYIGAGNNINAGTLHGPRTNYILEIFKS